jgi:hypothetical protein
MITGKYIYQLKKNIMSIKKQNINDFLSEEKELAGIILATIETVNETEVQITPWDNDGCNCNNSLVVPKDSIEFVEKTGDMHYCCGKNHSVVKINLKKDASLPIEKVLQQLINATVEKDIPCNENALPENFAMDVSTIRSAYSQDMRSPKSCTPSHEIAQKSCFRINRFTGKKEYGGMSYLVVYTTPDGKICKREWSPCG